MFPTEIAHLTADDFPMAGNARKRRNEWASIDEAYDAYASKPPLNVMTPESLRAYVEYGLRDRGDGVFELKCAPEVEAARVLDGAARTARGTCFADVESPVLVACGETSRDISPQLAHADRRPPAPRHARGVARARALRPATGPRPVRDVDPRLREGVSCSSYAACRLSITPAHFSGSDLYGA